jgi:hypothetical protein
VDVVQASSESVADVVQAFRPAWPAIGRYITLVNSNGW